MKTLKMLLPLAAILCFCTACPGPDWYADPPDADGKTNAPEVVTIPFKAEFTAKFATISTNPMTCCGKGTGTGTCFENLSCNITRCGNPETGECLFTQDSYLYDKNGDKLYFTAWIKMNNPENGDPPFLTQKWTTNYYIYGGTGRFEGSSGSGTWKAYFTNVAGDENTAHSVLSGTLTVEKSKLTE